VNVRFHWHSRAGKGTARPETCACRRGRPPPPLVPALPLSSPRRPEAPAPGRRAALAAGLALALAAPRRAAAKLCVEADSVEAGDDCRRALLGRDTGAIREGDSLYTSGALNQDKNFTAASGVPVAVLGDEYAAATVALKAQIDAYATLDVFDKARRTDATSLPACAPPARRPRRAAAPPPHAAGYPPPCWRRWRRSRRRGRRCLVVLLANF